jgi:adenine phosphoribosyltransferase
MDSDLKKWIRSVPDFPKEGILFRDITPALLQPGAFSAICDLLVQRYEQKEFDKIAAIESRGFIFAAVLAYKLGKGLIPLRKPGKLPWKTISETYALEYGEATLEMHIDAVGSGERVLVVDDLLATGGTAAATVRLIERQGGIVEEIAFVIELEALGGRKRLAGKPVFSLIAF